MMLFWLFAAVFTLVVYLLFGWALRQPLRLQPDLDLHANLLVHRQRCEELAADLAAGKIDSTQYEQLLTELERELLELSPSTETSDPPRRSGLLPVFMSLGVVPLAAMTLYFALGRPDLLNPQVEKAQTAPSLEEAIAKIEHRLQDHPEDLEGWVLLGRAYQATGQVDRAAAAYRQARKLAPEDPEIQLAYAEALAQAQGGELKGEALALIEQVLAEHADHPHALWLAGIAALQKGDHEGAQVHWQKLLAQLPAGSRPYQQLLAMMQEAGLNPLAPSPTQGKVGSKPVVAIQVTVRLKEALADQVKPEDPVFIFARAEQGPPMPLAILRKQVKDLPATVTLDDSLAMLPQLKLSQFTKVVIGARVAKSGSPQGAPGDLEGFRRLDVKDQAQVEVVIDQIRS
jgi:cytochrome c-type biogenesis protein CcmH